MRRIAAALAAVLVLVLAQHGGSGMAAAQAPLQPPPQIDGVARLLLHIEQAMQAGNPAAYLNMLSAVANRQFAVQTIGNLIVPGITRAVIRERDRTPLEGTLPGDGYRLMVEILTERGIRGRVATWRLDVQRVPTDTNQDEWRIAGQQQAATIDGLYRLSLSPTRQYRVRDLVLASDDLEVRLADGYLFVAETPDGPTALALLPSGTATFRFRPAPETEREQVRFYSGSDRVEGACDGVFVRVHPVDFAARVAASALTEEPVDPALFRRAEGYFREQIGKSYSIDLGDLSRDLWSLPPAPGDLIVEIRTRRFQDLTYTKSTGDAEDITFFDRRRRRNISIYASADHLKANGRFFDEDSGADYDITQYGLDVSFDPERRWLDGRALVRLRVTAPAVTNLTLRLAESLTVKSIYSSDLGRLLPLRVRGQNNIVINLPGYAQRGTELALVIAYEGRLDPGDPDREVIAPQFPTQDSQFQGIRDDAPAFVGEPSLLYSTHAYWYPQGSVTDFATATMHLTVPEPYAVLASGDLAPGSPVVVPARDRQPAARLYTYEAARPVRYLSCLISRFTHVAARNVSLVDALATLASGNGAALPAGTMPAGASNNEVELSVEANPRQVSKAKAGAPVADDLLRFYTSLIGDCPYPSFTVALIEKELPGGHSPAYLTILNQTFPGSTGLNWANDPASFPAYPDFFIAHETAHQWWGQAVGWRSYHDQWISEGFAQYFAALYARKSRGETLFGDILRRMAKWARDEGDKGPVSLGYRLGHIQGDSRIFRAVVYNKSAVVLHMLRRLVGDDAFFRGVRRFYFGSRFAKAGTEDVRAAMEHESGQQLQAFFDAWVHGSGTPQVRVTWQRDPAVEGTARLRVEQVGRLFPFPVTATIRYADGSLEDVPLVISGHVLEVQLPLKGTPREITLNRDGLTPLVVVQ